MPLLHTLWLLTGAGNANFFYAATMVYGLNATLAIADVLGAIIDLDVRRRLTDVLHIGKVVDSSEEEQVGQVGLPSGWTVTQLASLE